MATTDIVAGIQELVRNRARVAKFVFKVAEDEEFQLIRKILDDNIKFTDDFIAQKTKEDPEGHKPVPPIPQIIPLTPAPATT